MHFASQTPLPSAPAGFEWERLPRDRPGTSQPRWSGLRQGALLGKDA